MKSSSVSMIVGVLFGLGLGYGAAQLSGPGSDGVVSAPPSQDLEAKAIDAAPIVSIAAPPSDQDRDAAAARQKAKAAPAKKAAARQSSLPALVKELETIGKSPPGKKNRKRESDLFDRWVEIDPAGAAAWAAAVFAAGGDEEPLRKAMREYADKNPREAAEWAASLASPLVRDSALREAFETWSSRDPRSASEMVSFLPIGSAQLTAATVVAKHFAAIDFEGALGWIGSLPAPAQGVAFQTIMRVQWDHTDSNNPGAALPWLLSQSSVSFRNQGVRFIATEWAKRDPLSALAYAPAVVRQRDRSLFVETALRTYAQTNPRQAAVWLANQPSSPETDRLMNQVTATWAAFAPLETARWASELRNPALREKSIASAAESWAKIDPEGLAGWLGSLSDSSARDAAVYGATRAWIQDDPASAAQWAAGIVNPEKRNESLTQAVREWKNRDLAAAVSFVRTNPAIDNALRQRLLR